MRKKGVSVRHLTIRAGGLLCLILVLVGVLAGCPNQRKRVVTPESVAGQNDPDWKILKEPSRPQQPGSH